tara:strand:- start:24 stop:389 length:366 start_codon:yes stop_codon:yes gene_type:complete
MKTYNQFITELNKFERFLLKQGIKAIKKLNPGQSSKSVKKSVERTVKSFRSDPGNPFLPYKKIENPDKFSNLATNRKSIHPPTADVAQSKITDMKVDLIRKKIRRRKDTEGMLKRMFDKEL